MHTFLDNFHQGGTYSAQIASHQAELKREEKFTNNRSVNISSLQTDYLNHDHSSDFGRNSERAHAVQKKCTFFVEVPPENIDIHSIILISEFQTNGKKCIRKLKSHCPNMTFADKSRYDRNFEQITYKGGESKIIYIKGFQNAHALSVSVGNSYFEDHLMHTFLDNFHQGGQ